ncbi:Beta-lactamase/transpeptidase-like protein [Pseudocohnilembus persalinus]|uniref:Beta-lactamase/transpeptidase-like protein n=1 Tax=Pseudocohnilembus persalinus TaxID=266149 RepID=A0A0V0QDG8_PSEPJ|nr:Beta-lactamase/transpeptidase-like protein [Pseudocohnilembus persalinus]|eukprot:KRX00226.1 Beta-lactamase/transpeptidase-like protein [Pseudocohnilembus persalinus]
MSQYIPEEFTKKVRLQLPGIIVGYTGLLLTTYNMIHLQIYDFFFYIIIMVILGLMIGGSEFSLIFTLFGLKRPVYYVKGEYRKDFQKIRDQYIKNFEDGMEQQSQVAVYYKGELVVDLCGSFNFKDKNYSHDSLQPIFSSGKSVETVVIAMMVDRGHLDYNEKVSKYWPEFGQKGKQDFTLADVLRHEVGLARLGKLKNIEDTLIQNIKANKIGQIIEEAEPIFSSKKTNREYHAMSRGLILNEIVRRVDPQKRTIGEIVNEELNCKYRTNIYFGVDNAQDLHISELTIGFLTNFIWAFFQSLVPNSLGRKIASNTLILLIVRFIALKKIDNTANVDNFSKRFLKGQITSSNGISNARSLAKIANIMANKGKIDDNQLISEKTVALANSQGIVKTDSLFSRTSKFTIGGNNVYDKDQQLGILYDSEGFIGWSGLGGSLVRFQKLELIILYLLMFYFNQYQCD